MAHECLVRGAESARGDRRQPRMQGGALDPVAVTLSVTIQELVTHGGEGQSAGRIDLAIVNRRDRRGRVQPQPLAHPAAPHARTLQNERRADRAGAQDHEPGVDRLRARLAPGGRIAPHDRHLLARHGAAASHELDPLDACIGHQCRAGGDRPWQPDHQPALLGVVAASHAAKARPYAPLGVDHCRRGAPAELHGPVEDDPVVGRVRVVGDLAGMHLALDLVEHRRQLGGTQPRDAEAGRPFIEHMVRRAQHDEPVHRRAAAHTAALEEREPLVRGRPEPLVGVEPLLCGPLEFVKGVPLHQRSLLEHRDLKAGLGEPSRGHPATRSGADHEHIGCPGQAVHGDDRPARRDSGRRRPCRFGHSRHGVVVAGRAGERTLPRQLGSAVMQRPAIADGLLYGRTTIVKKEDQPPDGLHHRPEGRESRQCPAADPCVLGRGAPEGKGHRISRCQQRREGVPHDRHREEEIGADRRRHGGHAGREPRQQVHRHRAAVVRTRHNAAGGSVEGGALGSGEGPWRRCVALTCRGLARRRKNGARHLLNQRAPPLAVHPRSRPAHGPFL